jgi:hypothetical protein
MLKAEKYAELNDTVRKVTDTMIKNQGYAYTAGYLQSVLVEIIDRYVKEDSDLSMIQIRLLSAGINNNLDNMK